MNIILLPNSVPIFSKLFKVEIAVSSVPAIKDWLNSLAEIAAKFSIAQLESLHRYLIRFGTLFGTKTRP